MLNYHKIKSLIVNVFLLLIVTFFSLLICEFAVRKILPFSLKQDERNLSYNHHQTLGWFPKPNLQQKFIGSQEITVSHNNQGFRDANNHSNSPALMFLGDSFVWGYDVENEQIFTSVLQKKLQQQYAVYNLGVSGYGTDQEFLLLQQFYDKIKPQKVFLIFCANDYYNNSSNVVYGGYYKPYFLQNNTSELLLQGVPVPISGNYKMLNFSSNHHILAKSHVVQWLAKLFYRAKHNLAKKRSLPDPTWAILKNINQFLQAKNTQFIVGIIDSDDDLEKFLKQQNITFINLKNDFRFPQQGNHWNRQGHEFVADKIFNWLNQNK